MTEKEIIKKIEEFENDDEEGDSWTGYFIATDKQIIEIKISNYQQCCERYGYLSSDDDFEQYIGSELLDICVVDEKLKSTALKGRKICEYFWDLDEGAAVFVNVVTNLGTIQFTLYNAHNGYYGHYVNIISKKLYREFSI